MNKINNLFLFVLIVSAIHCEIITPKATSATMTSSTSASTASIVQKLAIKLERAPIYAYPGIITDFIVTPIVQRTQDEIENLFIYEFSDNKYLPPKVYISIG